MRNRLLVVIFVVSFFWLAATSVAARSFTYPSYDVDVQVNQDSTVDVTEKLTYRFVGEYSGVIRQITLIDPSRQRYCQQNGLSCGGFEELSLQGVYDQNNQLVPKDNYEVYTEVNDDTGESFFVIKWVVWAGGKQHDGSETFSWTIKYRLFGSLGWIGQDANDQYAELYWNALPETRGGDVEAANVNIHFPSSVSPKIKDLQVYDDYGSDYTYLVDGQTIALQMENIGSSGNFTVAYAFPFGAIDRPANLTYSALLPWFGIGVKIDGTDLGDLGGEFDSLPAGQRQIEFYFGGYNSRMYDLLVAPGGEYQLDATLTPGAIMGILLLADIALNVLGLVLIPVAIMLVYRRWRRQGRDLGKPASIIPLYHPPQDVAPYLLGSLRDEKVDRQDVTGSIIDLAYRGYIKIKELEKGKNYQLTKLEGKKGDAGLNTLEQQLLDALFDSGDEVDTKELAGKFFSKYIKLESAIYDELVSRGFFSKSPRATRAANIGCAIGVIILGMIATVLMATVGTAILGVLGPALLGVAVITGGISLLAVANHMPAKTAAGGKVYGEVLGFEMYLHFAERYRLQGLKPEEFEKFLSYAIVFGIEKEWAQKFEGIYKGQPEWLEADGNIVWDAYWISSFSRSFSNSVNNTVYSAPSSSGSGSGSWGGGSFGGFSGGGGGGGGSGAF